MRELSMPSSTIRLGLLSHLVSRVAVHSSMSASQPHQNLPRTLGLPERVRVATLSPKGHLHTEIAFIKIIIRARAEWGVAATPTLTPPVYPEVLLQSVSSLYFLRLWGGGGVGPIPCRV